MVTDPIGLHCANSFNKNTELKTKTWKGNKDKIRAAIKGRREKVKKEYLTHLASGYVAGCAHEKEVSRAREAAWVI